MRLKNAFDREHTPRLLLGLVGALVFLAVVAVPATALSHFYGNLDALSDDVRRADFEAAKARLDEVTGFYDGARGLGLQWLADSYLFQDAFLQRAAFAYLVGQYDLVVTDLSTRIDDPRASQLLGNAKFRLAQQRYRAIEGENAKAAAAKATIVQEVIEQINPDYERALRGDITDRFDYKWNYDLTSDAEATRRALEPIRKADPPELEQMKGEGTPVRRRRG